MKTETTLIVYGSGTVPSGQSINYAIGDGKVKECPTLTFLTDVPVPFGTELRVTVEATGILAPENLPATELFAGCDDCSPTEETVQDGGIQ